MFWRQERGGKGFGSGGRAGGLQRALLFITAWVWAYKTQPWWSTCLGSSRNSNKNELHRLERAQRRELFVYFSASRPLESGLGC